MKHENRINVKELWGWVAFILVMVSGIHFFCSESGTGTKPVTPASPETRERLYWCFVCTMLAYGCIVTYRVKAQESREDSEASEKASEWKRALDAMKQRRTRHRPR
jgi:hypothetical protein